MCRSDEKLMEKAYLKVVVFLVILFGVFAGDVWAEPQFGGDVSGVVACTCGDNAGGHYFIVSDPHGDENGGPASYVSGPNTDVRDCPPIADGEEVLGMHNEDDEICEIEVDGDCIEVGSGKGVDMYGTSPNNCGSHKTSASSKIVEDIKRKMDKGDRVVGSGTTSSSEKTDKSEKVVEKIKQKRDSEDNKINSSEDIDNPEATDLSESVVRDVVQARDRGDKIRGSKSRSILDDVGISLPVEEGVTVLGNRDENVFVAKNDNVETPSSVDNVVIDRQSDKKNDSWKMTVSLIGFGLGSYFVGKAGRKIVKK